MGYQYGIWYTDVDIHRIDVVILDIDIGYLVTLIEIRVESAPSLRSSNSNTINCFRILLSV